MNELEQMSDRELLLELVAEKRRLERWDKVRQIIILILLIGIVIALAIYIPKILQFIEEYNQFMQQMHEMSESLQTISNTLNSLQLQEYSGDINGLMEFLKQFSNLFQP